MKYNRQFMEKFLNENKYNQAKTMKEKHEIPEATFYRWLKKYRDMDGANSEEIARIINQRKAEEEKMLQALREEYDRKIEKLREDAQKTMHKNMMAYKEWLEILILVHTDVDIDDLMANTKSRYVFETLVHV